MDEYTKEEIAINGNQMYGGKRHDQICDELEASGYKDYELNLVSVGIWKGIESERIFQEKKLKEKEEYIAMLEAHISRDVDIGGLSRPFDINLHIEEEANERARFAKKYLGNQKEWINE